MTAARYGAGRQDAPGVWLGKVKGGSQERPKGRWYPVGEVEERASHDGNSFATIFRQGAYGVAAAHTWPWYATRPLRDVPRPRSEWRVGGINLPTWCRDRSRSGDGISNQG